ncbi:hypothetical protein PYE51_17670 [Vibrio aestuarianus]|uniref:Uncharacterized protein n=1 Tax=Vibrio aestuarianus TaxID=28171 RepID=A0AAX3U7W8_9VIBR|nr:hypothetical protein [Vibrio aestuarianus]WGK83190.1 hypothetical protein PYE51_17670 [Vibrio aestuarianus]
MKRPLIALLLFSVSCTLQAGYCTTSNWDKGVDLYKKYENAYNAVIDPHNQQIDIYNEFDFVGHIITSPITDGQLYDSLQKQLQLVQQHQQSLFELQKQIKRTETGLDKARQLWEKLADYCYDEDKYDDYKSGRNNMRMAKETKDKANNIKVSLDRMQKKYQKEIETLKAIQLNEKLKGEALTCNEAWQKTNHVVVDDTRSIFFQNFLVSQHHSDRDHSFTTRPFAISEYFPVSETFPIHPYYDTEKTQLRQIKKVNKQIQAMDKFVYGLSQLETKESEFLHNLSHDDVKQLTYWLSQNADALPSAVTKKIFSGEQKLSDDQITTVKALANRSLSELLAVRHKFDVFIDRDKQNNKRAFIRFNHSCKPGQAWEGIASQVNGQPISLRYECLKSAYSDSTSLYAIPEDAQGMETLVKEFNKKVWVEVELSVDNKPHLTKFWANGFSKAWQSL